MRFLTVLSISVAMGGCVSTGLTERPWQLSNEYCSYPVGFPKQIVVTDKVALLESFFRRKLVLQDAAGNDKGLDFKIEKVLRDKVFFTVRMPLRRALLASETSWPIERHCGRLELVYDSAHQPKPILVFIQMHSGDECEQKLFDFSRETAIFAGAVGACPLGHNGWQAFD